MHVINKLNKIIMPWTKSDYPVSMKNLPLKVRNKAIDALLDKKNMDEGILIATSISRAKIGLLTVDLILNDNSKKFWQTGKTNFL